MHSRTPVLELPGADTGTAAWALIGRYVTADDLSVTVSSAADAIEAYLTTPAEDLFAPGGLRVSHGGVVIAPGCCAGLEQWREWFDALAGRVVGLGHDPDVWLERRGNVVRVWRQDGDGSPAYVDIARDALPQLLDGVQARLAVFLGALRRWADEVVPGHGDLLMGAADAHLRVNLSPDPIINY